MAEQTPVDEMNYDALAQDALRGVIRSALERAASPDGIPGEHHFYITFKTRAPGVSVPPDVDCTISCDLTAICCSSSSRLTLMAYVVTVVVLPLTFNATALRVLNPNVATAIALTAITQTATRTRRSIIKRCGVHLRAIPTSFLTRRQWRIGHTSA